MDAEMDADTVAAIYIRLSATTLSESLRIALDSKSESDPALPSLTKEEVNVRVLLGIFFMKPVLTRIVEANHKAIFDQSGLGRSGVKFIDFDLWMKSVQKAKDIVVARTIVVDKRDQRKRDSELKVQVGGVYSALWYGHHACYVPRSYDPFTLEFLHLFTKAEFHQYQKFLRWIQFKMTGDYQKILKELNSAPYPVPQVGETSKQPKQS